ncbi:MAG: lamin tail domain-containing protein, partial [Clostridia bacterium]|nr:lamin tail domain-containing protein [Clostridia bacterium]
DDHCEGLEWLSTSDIPVEKWYASAMYTGVKEKKHPAVKAADERGASVTWLRRGDSIPLGDTGAVFNVLAPSSLNTDKDDNNSLVMMLESSDGRVLLTGDMELVQESELLRYGDDLSCHVLKVANHADDDTTGSAFVKEASPKLAVISTSTYEKPETPDSGVLKRLSSSGAECIVTQDGTAGVYITLKDSNITWQYVDISAPQTKITLREVVPGDDIIVLYNESSETVDLSGWYLFSDKGEELFVLPEGCTMPPESRLVIGTESSEDEDADIIWPEKKVINKSKTDVITLYDRYGRAVDSLSNGY